MANFESNSDYEKSRFENVYICRWIRSHGGAGFAQDLVKFGLIDEFRLVIHPVVLGKGLPLFTGAPQPFDLALESSTSFPGGIVANIYRKG